MSESKTRIIVVDDDARLRELLNRYLSDQGFSVRTASDATDMNRWLARERYDLMVLDLMMPGEDGLSICRRLRGLGDKMMELARGREFGAFDRSIDVQISRLRKLLEADPAKPVYIQTVWGFGYVFIPDGKAA